MRALLLTAVAGLLAFGAGLAGTYFVLPIAAPGLVEGARAEADSLDALALLPDDPFSEDSLSALAPSAGDSASLLPDSLTALRARLHEAERRIPVLLDQIQALEAQVSGPQQQRARVSELASTLTRLEDRELGRLLGQLDHEVLATLYAEASQRDRTRLLAALAPARAAVLIRRAAGMPPAAPTSLRYDEDDDAAYPPSPAY